MQATSDTSTLQWLLLGVLLAGGHETWHLMLSELDLATAEGGQRDVGDLELLGWSAHFEWQVVLERVIEGENWLMKGGMGWDVLEREGECGREKKS